MVRKTFQLIPTLGSSDKVLVSRSLGEGSLDTDDGGHERTLFRDALVWVYAGYKGFLRLYV